ncbi:DMT family transporter [Aequorivita sp. H23M31]|uniref:DMT family transporter n=1 Tax=Aequorivita ciconiae TaxID=2494375 RepID=A0A410G078_9FLAO|nr:DMT family transporter [Aequorivita sp. H23M31]QAA80678.1 DMT family transporter [Aequorivita sp. H23M31]
MIALALSILSSTTIYVVFKIFTRYNINTLHAIVTNYVVATFCGILLQPNEIHLAQTFQYSWFPFALGLGVLFIIVFNLMGITAQRNGLSVVSVAAKMSVVIPILFGLLYYKESLGNLKFIGILLALVAVYLVSIKREDSLKIKASNFIFPVLVFTGSGVIDTSVKYLEGEYVGKDDISIFSATIYTMAALVGIGILSVQALQGKFQFQFKNVVGGIALGIPNFFSIYFLLQALRSGIFESSGIFTINNVSVVMISTLLGILLFQEKLLIKNWIGIILAIFGILLITLGKW